VGLRRLGQRRLPPLRRSTPPCSGSTWRAGPESQGPDTANRDTLSGELGTLHEHLTEHLDLEERAILPLAASVLTDAEWHAIGDAAVAAMPKSAPPLAFGMFAYEGDPAVLRDMLNTAPRRALLMWNE